MAGVAGLPAPGYRTIAAHCGVDRKTVRRYVEAAQAAGLHRSDGVEAVDDGLIGAVADAVRPVRRMATAQRGNSCWGLRTRSPRGWPAMVSGVR
ncbi:hypothetical protein L836_0984 [Mycobacteroides abscessus MAB_110811_2726]|nr:helix-turn-helix domain-containing protein [Mycobacteroides abscessus]ETZ64800.1 hypothetical protein L836_0984 [Mycobacteroides abscessus MAB_110811_2726]